MYYNNNNNIWYNITYLNENKIFFKYLRVHINLYILGDILLLK